ncbi:TetR/AcrR family transcriptional regulator [Mycobacterium sp. CVI_P3]|uniref:TetR/AcrR family transcriptional regulator n=1 Tax=Mycobacterium pinniadriaticum TaxID=2994102 RepID=A0ABT3SAY1_9MYCO|nr:TetR/AcrR family transcriptional regulator [Mycobacterium pinniadriaticum]MCX2930042.1 TetR/AcrR family transcriptional regulator [Mycobacterium pinniadriaticum]MCX2936309.1 TetR/AcrR family transcriptional regulator [Mycobacterium pinniadriaticum]
MADHAKAPSRAVRRQAETRAALIKAASEIIAERGLDGLRVSDVTERANVAFGTFYNQFKVKDDVVEAVVEQALVSLARSIEESPANAHPAEAVVASTRAIVRIAYDNPDLARLLINLEQAESRFERIIRPQAGAMLKRGVAEGVFVIDDFETILTMAIAASFEVIRGILDGRLGRDADLTCAQALLRLVGVDRVDAARYSGAVAHRSSAR